MNANDLSSYCEGGTGMGKELDITKVTDELKAEDVILKEARSIYHSGKALEYFLESAARSHADDVAAIRGLFYSYASTLVENCKGINCMITGDTGTGKSDIILTVLERIPSTAYSNRKLSDAVLWRMKLRPGTVLVFDDQTLSLTIQEILKNLKWDRPTEYSVANKVDQEKTVDYHIPERCPFWIAKVEGSGDEQVWDRTIMYEADDSLDHCKRRDVISDRYLRDPGLRTEVDRSKIICRKIWHLIQLDAGKEGKRTIVVPFTITGGMKDVRTRLMFISLIQAHCILCAPQRSTDKNGFLVADIDDAIAALEHMNPLMRDEGGSQVRGLLINEKILLAKLAEKDSDMYDRADLMEMTGFSDKNLTYACRGRDGHSGLFAKCPAITEIDLRTSRYMDELDATISKSRKGVVWNREIYKTWMNNTPFLIDGKTLEELKESKL